MENISCLKPSAHQPNQAIQSSGFFILKNNETLLGYISYNNVSLADIKTTEKMIQYSKILGQVEVINDNGTILTVVVAKTGETKKLMKSIANLSDVPFAKEVKAKSKPMRELTAEEEAHLTKTSNLLINTLIKSNMNYRSGRAGASSINK